MSDTNNEATFPKGTGFGGKYTSLPKDYRKKLSAPMPKEAIKQHPAKKFLSTIKAIYITERLNDVFGLSGWDLESEVVDNTMDGDVPYIVVKGRIYIRMFDLYTPYQYGGHHTGGRNTEPADGYKSAVTDMQGKCASYLEIGIQVFKGQPDSQVANISKKVVNNKPKATPKKEKEEVVDDKPTPEEVYNNVSQDINSYTDKKSLKDDAEVIVFNARMDGCSEDHCDVLKKLINEQYQAL